MPTRSVHSAFVVGAGFSMYAGMPLQDQFTSALLGGKGKGTGPSGAVVQYLRKFVNRAFDHSPTAGARFWPELEDIFTCLDLSANTGHNLGPRYKPAELRTVRRALIYRTITMLRENYLKARKRQDEPWQQLLDLMQRVDTKRTGFISTNWDTVVEDMLEKTRNIQWFDYGCDAFRASLHLGHKTLKEVKPLKRTGALVVKMHGSLNWLYCESCRFLFWTPTKETYKVAGQLLSPEEWNKIDPDNHHAADRWLCSHCGGKSLGTRLATFSYRKALDFPMFQKSWFSAERILGEARNWIFIGYSLPAADFEFKYLLKRVQLSRVEPPNFVVVSGGSKVERTYENYQRFFGRQIKSTKNFFANGLEEAAIQYISDVAK